MSPSAPSVAPWRSTFLSHIESLDLQNMTLSTVDINKNPHSRSAADAEYVPRARTVIFRGMWASLPVNPKNPADLNPDEYTSDMPTITTDVRMHKVPQLLRGDEDGCQSGVGGPFEAVVWAAPHSTQWRLRGHVCVVGPDIESDGAAPVRSALKARMRETGEMSSSQSKTWSWSRELTAHFGNLSPGMRGLFRNPPPGSRKSGGAEPGLGLGQGHKVEDLHDETARKNFRVLVLVPDEVDRVDFSDPTTAQRWNYSLDESGRWVTVELWP